MCDWAQQAVAREPAIVFAQEVTEPWLEVWEGAGYRVSRGVDRGWKIHSALLTCEDLDVAELTASDHANLGYHGSYVAAGRWKNSPVGTTILASVHASPQLADPSGDGWTGSLPEPRDGGGDPRYVPRKLWDSDLLLATLRDLAGRGERALLAAGDFNEARDDDPAGRGSWGAEYFHRVHDYGLEDWLFAEWDENERPTRAGLQLDRVLISPPARPLVASTPEPHVDPGWAQGGRADLSDHAPIWFRVAAV